jgi:hypothetical protein
MHKRNWNILCNNGLGYSNTVPRVGKKKGLPAKNCNEDCGARWVFFQSAEIECRIFKHLKDLSGAFWIIYTITLNNSRKIFPTSGCYRRKSEKGRKILPTSGCYRRKSEKEKKNISHLWLLQEEIRERKKEKYFPPLVATGGNQRKKEKHFPPLVATGGNQRKKEKYFPPLVATGENQRKKQKYFPPLVATGGNQSPPSETNPDSGIRQIKNGIESRSQSYICPSH